MAGAAETLLQVTVLLGRAVVALRDRLALAIKALIALRPTLPRAVAPLITGERAQVWQAPGQLPSQALRPVATARNGPRKGLAAGAGVIVGVLMR